MVRPEKILKELSRLWVDLSHEQMEETPQGEGGVLRACAMTMITLADESEDPTNVGETVALLMKEHPSRAVLIRLRSSDVECLESRVFAQCWMPFGQRRQICCEQIEITASLSSLDDVPGLVLPLTVPDMPVILWNRSPRLFETSGFPRIVAMSDKLIVDSGAFADLHRAFEVVSGQIGGGRLVADLAWVRTTRWRETVSQIFINHECLAALPTLTSASVEFGSDRPGPEAIYLAAWLQSGLERVGSPAKVQLVHGSGPAITALTLTSPDACRISVHGDRSGAVDVKANKLEHRVVFPEPSDYLALQEELSITGRDSVFEDALARVNSFLPPVSVQ